MSTDPIRAEALVGPWQVAIASDDGGWICHIDDVREDITSGDTTPDEYQIVIVRGSAAPISTDDEPRLPSSCKPEDHAAEFIGFGDLAELNTRWHQAVAMAAGLNAAAGGVQ